MTNGKRNWLIILVLAITFGSSEARASGFSSPFQDNQADKPKCDHPSGGGGGDSKKDAKADKKSKKSDKDKKADKKPDKKADKKETPKPPA